MDNLRRLLQRLCQSRERNWELQNNRLVVPVGKGGRQQEIEFERDGHDYVLTSVVLGRHQVTKDAKNWRELARLAWQRNAAGQVVAFAFDARDRLVGQIRHPAAHLDLEELDFYVTTLAYDCDRFEYLVSGSRE